MFTGLDIYDKITQTKDYYLFDSELDILNKHGAAIVSKQKFDLTTRWANCRAVQAKRLFASKRLPNVPASDSDSDGVPTLGDTASSKSSDEVPSSAEEDQADPDALLEDDPGFDRLPGKGYKEKWGDSKVGKNNFG